MEPIQPLILAHRGVRAHFPENTLAAFRAAVAQGADGVELDIFRSADGVLVVSHDNDLAKHSCAQRTVSERTASGSLIRQLPWREIQRVRFAGDEHIPRLEEVLELLQETKLLINIEIKSTGLKTDGIEGTLATLLKKFFPGFSDRVWLSSFNPLHLWRFKKLLPQVPLGTLRTPGDGLQGWIGRRTLWAQLLPAASINLQYSLITPRLVQDCHRQGRQVWAWTINDPILAQKLTDMGVDVLISDDPAVLKAVAHRKTTPRNDTLETHRGNP